MRIPDAPWIRDEEYYRNQYHYTPDPDYEKFIDDDEEEYEEEEEEDDNEDPV